MGFWFYTPVSPVRWHGCLRDPGCVESRSPLPAFKNLGRGVF